MKKYFYWCKKTKDDMITISVGEVLATSYQEVESLPDFMQWPPTDKLAVYIKIMSSDKWIEFWRNGFSEDMNWLDLFNEIKAKIKSYD